MGLKCEYASWSAFDYLKAFCVIVVCLYTTPRVIHHVCVMLGRFCRRYMQRTNDTAPAAPTALEELPTDSWPNVSQIENLHDHVLEDYH